MLPTVQAKNPGFGTHAASQIKTPGETRLTLLPPMTLQYYDPASFILAGRPPCPELTPAPPNMGRAQDVSTNGCPKLLLSLPTTVPSWTPGSLACASQLCSPLHPTPHSLPGQPPGFWMHTVATLWGTEEVSQALEASSGHLGTELQGPRYPAHDLEGHRLQGPHSLGPTGSPALYRVTVA